MPEVEEVLAATAVASFLDPAVWAARSEHEAAALAMAPVGDAFDLDDVADKTLKDLREDQPADASVIISVASVFPKSDQPIAAPVIYRNHWRVVTQGSVATVSVVVVAGYDVSRGRSAAPIVIGRGFSILIDEKDGRANLTFTTDGMVWLANGCSIVTDGLLRASEDLPEKAVKVMRREFADATPDDPLAALEPLSKIEGVGSFDDADARACLRDKKS